MSIPHINIHSIHANTKTGEFYNFLNLNDIEVMSRLLTLHFLASLTNNVSLSLFKYLIDYARGLYVKTCICHI